ncbi:hypothetical protein [Rummeliibacillus pycnus]|uniref:hypothetical protein n=1 Tax=Rummeliibacillus pycnus TaxID=101070 RepID=UPI0037C56F84
MNKVIKNVTATMLGAALLTSTFVQVPTAEAKTTIKKVTNNVKVKSEKLVSTKNSKVIAGYALYKSKLYKNGKLYTGIVNSTYYKNGVKGKGTYKNKYYENGKLFTGYAASINYINGLKRNGLYNGRYYKDGDFLTGETEDGIFYKFGEIAYGPFRGVIYNKGIKNVGINRIGKAYYKDQNYYMGNYTDNGKQIYVLKGYPYDIDGIDSLINSSNESLEIAKNEFREFSGHLADVKDDNSNMWSTLLDIKMSTEYIYAATIVAKGLNAPETKIAEIQNQLTAIQEFFEYVKVKHSIVIENMKVKGYSEEEITKESNNDRIIDTNTMVKNATDVLANGITESNTSYYSLNPNVDDHSWLAIDWDSPWIRYPEDDEY